MPNNYRQKTIFPHRYSKIFYDFWWSHEALWGALIQRLKTERDDLILVTGDTGCLSGDTIVAGQNKTLGELYKSGVREINTVSLKKFSENKGPYYPVKSKSQIIDSGIKEVYEIELEDGRKVIATKDHKLFKEHKKTMKEVEVKDLKVGDRLREYPYRQHFEKDKNKKQKIRDDNYNPKGICLKCKSLFYKEKHRKRILCKNCTKKIKKTKPGNWFEWEDNVLRQFYYDYSKKDLINLLKSRNWCGILHRAHRLGLKRNPKFQKEAIDKLAWTSKNNPMNDKKIIKKVSDKLIEGYQSGKIKVTGIALKSKLGLTKKENHPNWLGGISFEPYDSRWDNKFKEKIRKRDNYICNLCGKQDNVVHHIDYDKKNTTEINCITLCNSCHMKTNYNRKNWEEKLKKIIQDKYEVIQCIQ